MSTYSEGGSSNEESLKCSDTCHTQAKSLDMSRAPAAPQSYASSCTGIADIELLRGVGGKSTAIVIQG